MKIWSKVAQKPLTMVMGMKMWMIDWNAIGDYQSVQQQLMLIGDDMY